MPQRRARHAIHATSRQHPFAEDCVWPRCKAPIGEVSAPLCHAHLSQAFRIFRTSYLFALEYKPDYLLSEPLERAGIQMPTPVRQTPGLVYFVRLDRLIKIGFTTDLDRRMTAVPHEEILGTVPGTMEDEKRCHAAFDHLRVTGEWFRAEPELLAFIADVAT